MKCEDLLRMLNDYVDGDIDPAICEDFEHHLQDCNPCKVVVDNIRKTIKLYRDGAEYEIPMRFRTRLHETLQEKWGQRPGSASEASEKHQV
ncbi:MAG TPA: zf-HC2 domain-containing protein [Candidatus Brocadiia bacterium]|nr:zf-HC2 domain-containing protein [Candidatus Brocadiia bacterium]